MKSHSAETSPINLDYYYYYRDDDDNDGGNNNNDDDDDDDEKYKYDHPFCFIFKECFTIGKTTTANTIFQILNPPVCE